jgi:hypothetical protein
LIATIALHSERGERPPVVGPADGPIPASYFGMTINAPLTTPWPQLDFASLRTWDANVSWSDIAPRPWAYDWRKFDAVVNLAASHHVELVYTFGRTPRWAAADGDAYSPYGAGQCSPPARLRDWEDFVRAVLARAAGRIRFWEIWNEPQDPAFYCGDVATMVQLQRAAYTIIKSESTNYYVLTPSPTGSTGPSWMSRFLSAGGGQYADILAFHGYWDTRASSLVAVANRYRALTQDAGKNAMPIWDTEAGWGQTPVDMTPAEQAAFLAKYLLLHWSLGISRVYWYAYDNELRWGTLWDRRTGLRPPGVAYREVRAWMLGMVMTDRCAPDGGDERIWTCGLSAPGGYRARALWTEGSPRRYSVREPFRFYRDLDGHRHRIRDGAVVVTSSPVLLETRAR